MRISSSLPAIAAAVLVVGAGVAFAATTDFESIRVGTADQGGVTFFNGSVLNESATEPFTVADDLRVDGRISRLPDESGKPVIVDDDLEVTGDVTFGQKTGYLRLTGPAFVPEEPDEAGAKQYNSGGIVFNTSGTKDVFASVNLPDGAVITQMDVFGTDATGGKITATLNRRATGGSNEEIASVVSTAVTDTLGDLLGSDSALSNATIDNTTYGYTLGIDFTSSSGIGGYSISSVLLTYTYTAL